MKKILTLIILIIILVAMIWHRQARAQTPTVIQPTSTPAISPSNESDSFCPHIDQILKDPTEGNWTAQTKEGFWKSYNMSFATTLTRFAGAQWVGANLGQLTCVYHSEEVFNMQGQQSTQKTLPVLLVFHSIVFQPTGASWTHPSRGVYNCAPRNQGQKDCPFKIQIKAKPTNIYEEAESLKTDSSQPLQPPSY
jgi:hypothetical protein